jgi:hypothetical protein
MHIECSYRVQLARIAMLATVVFAGLLSLVGSGGGAGSICDTYPDSCKPPSLQVTVVPPDLTVQVGSSASFSALPSGNAGGVSYQWQRSNDGGANFVDLPGATTAQLSLPNVNLADDGARFQVVAYITGYEATTRTTALARLGVVSASAVQFQDTEFELADWSVSAYLPAGATAFTVVAQRLPTGGADGAFQRTDFTVPSDTGTVRVLHLSATATYEPAMQGAIYSIDHAFDCAGLVRGTATATHLRLLIEQNGQRFIGPAPTTYCYRPDWSNSVRQLSLRAQDFALLDGTACAAGGPCPDFSVGAVPMHFGLVSITTSYPSEAAAYGIDNWKVSVWRR